MTDRRTGTPGVEDTVPDPTEAVDSTPDGEDVPWQWTDNEWLDLDIDDGTDPSEHPDIDLDPAAAPGDDDAGDGQHGLEPDGAAAPSLDDTPGDAAGDRDDAAGDRGAATVEAGESALPVAEESGPDEEATQDPGEEGGGEDGGGEDGGGEDGGGEDGGGEDAGDDAGGAGDGAEDEDAALFDPGEPPPVDTRSGEEVPISVAARRVWWAAIGLLVVATILVLVPIARRVLPPAGAGIASGLGWAADQAGSAADGAVAQWRDWTHELRTTAAAIPAEQIQEQLLLEGSGSALIVVTNADDRTVALALLARSPAGEASLALIPPGLFDILPGYGDFALAEATVFEGPDLTAITIANLLGVRVDAVIALGPGDVAAALSGTLAVDLPQPFMVDEGDDRERMVAAAGSGEFAAEAAESLLVVKGTSDPLEWLQRQAAVWEGVLERMSVDPSVPARLAAYGDAPEEQVMGLLAGVAAASTQVTVVPVSRVAVAGSAEGFQLAGSEAAEFVERRLGHLQLGDGNRIRVEVLNGNGRILTTRSVAESLILRGFHVIKTDNAEHFEFEGTLVIAQGRNHRVDAERAIGTLGTGELLLELRAPSGVVDISIIVGHDIPAGEG